MGMSFDKAVDRLEDLHFEQDNWEYEELTEDCLLNKEALRLAIDTMRKYQKLQVDYENRLKADMVAMLCALQLQFASHGCKDMRDCWWLIEEKINKLKEETEVKDDKS